MSEPRAPGERSGAAPSRATGEIDSGASGVGDIGGAVDVGDVGDAVGGAAAGTHPAAAGQPAPAAVDSIRDLHRHLGHEVELPGWIDSKRSSGKIAFLQVRAAGGVVQAVASRAELPAAEWEQIERVTQESSVKVRGTVREDRRAPSGVEIQLRGFTLVALSQDYPISPKEHGTAFLMEHRHLWLRSSRQRSALRVRSEVEQAIRDFFYERDFTLIDSPILTPAACEGTSTLFETDYFGDKAYLSQSGQLYLEPAAAALGKVYCFGPTFRAEKSKTRRHLMEFWMVEPEVAFLEFDGLCQLAEEFVCYLTARVLERCREELKTLERDTARLEQVVGPFPRVTYTEALDILHQAGKEIAWGDDFGGDEETLLASRFERPLLVTHFPASFKAFYMQPAPGNPDVVLGLDLLAPEGYGEIIGGSQRIHDHDLLLERIEQHQLPVSAFQWYLDVRRYGAFPHSGFGMGVERFVAWMCGLTHLRETIPYPRTLYKIYP
jgi:asparaginyl-tRNA synthetase